MPDMTEVYTITKEMKKITWAYYFHISAGDIRQR